MDPNSQQLFKTCGHVDERTEPSTLLFVDSIDQLKSRLIMGCFERADKCVEMNFVWRLDAICNSGAVGQGAKSSEAT